MIAIGNSVSPIDNGRGAEKENHHSLDVMGKVVRQSEKEWTSVEIQVGKGLSQLSFTNENTGLAFGKDAIQSTSDGGNSWKTVSALSRLVGFGDRIEKIKVGHDGILWMVVQHNDGSAFSLKDRVKVYQSLDGGKTWTLSIVQNSATFSDLQASGKNVWLVGKTFADTQPQQLLPLVLRSSGKDSNWANLSHNFKTYIDENGGDKYNHPILSKIGFTSLDCVILVAEERTLYKTCSEGKLWERVDDDRGNLDRRVLINHLSIAENTVRLVEASGGVEGTGSLLSVLDISNGKTLSSVSLTPYYVTQALWLSRDRIIVVGKQTGNPTVGGDRVDSDVILETLDGGKLWFEVFSKEIDKMSGTFFFAGPGTIWFVDEDGKAYKITKTQK